MAILLTFFQKNTRRNRSQVFKLLFRLGDYDIIDDFFCNVIVQNQKCHECFYELNKEKKSLFFNITL